MVGLVIIFNHRFDKNLPILRKIYGTRFRNIRFLMPFYDGAAEDVIPVYESSYQFQGFLAQAYGKLADMQCDEYLFVGDDVLLAPSIDENNAGEFFLGGNRKMYLSEIAPINAENVFCEWGHALRLPASFHSKGVEWKSELPPLEEAMLRFERFFGGKQSAVYTDLFFGKDLTERPDRVQKFLTNNKGTRDVAYPLAKGYSDVFMLKKEKLFDFSRMCGVFAAMNLFVEAAIPTSTVLLYDRDKVALDGDVGRRAVLFWNGEERGHLEEKYAYSVKKVYEDWQDEALYIHPVKLSKWEA